MTGRKPLDRSASRWTRLSQVGLAALLALAWMAAVAASPSPSPSRTPSSTMLSTSGDPTQRYTLIATVSGSGPTPTGTVTFETAPFGGPVTPIATVTLDASGSASEQRPGQFVGQDVRYVGVYSGDARYAPSTSPPLDVLPHPHFVAVTTTSLVASPSSALFGQAVVLTATTREGGGNVCGGGSTTFLDGTRALGSVAVNDSGVAVLSVTTFAVGTHQVTAQFFGGICTQPGGFDPLGSMSAPVTVVITGPGLPGTGRLPAPGPPASTPPAAALLALLAIAASLGSLAARRWRR